jgi:hypothetical protein
MSVAPITPQEAIASIDSTIPDSVIASVNDLIKEKMHPGTTSFTLTNSEVITRILDNFKEEGRHYSPETRPYWCSATREDIFKRGWMDFEPIFRKAGWVVHYDKPAYYESYEAYYEFKLK